MVKGQWHFDLIVSHSCEHDIAKTQEFPKVWSKTSTLTQDEVIHFGGHGHCDLTEDIFGCFSTIPIMIMTQ